MSSESSSIEGETDGPRIAVFRPDDERLVAAERTLRDLGARAVTDPMLSVQPTGTVPSEPAHFVVLTSRTGVEILAEAAWEPKSATIVAIGSATAAAIERAGFGEPLVPNEFTSAGVVSLLEDRVADRPVIVARSDHGSAVLTDGLEAAGAHVREVVLYRLARPDGAGRSTELAATGVLDAALFTSRLTVEHFLACAEERGIDGREALSSITIGAIGPPTADRLEAAGLSVDVVASTADFSVLAEETVDRFDQ